jgi:glucokinase
MTTSYLGVDVGGTKCAVSLGTCNDDRFEIITKHQISTLEFDTPNHIINELIKLAQQLLNDSQFQSNDVKAIGVSCGGPLDAKNGLILSPPNLRGWDRIPIVERLQNALNIKAFLENDVNACALAE